MAIKLSRYACRKTKARLKGLRVYARELDKIREWRESRCCVVLIGRLEGIRLGEKQKNLRQKQSGSTK